MRKENSRKKQEKRIHYNLISTSPKKFLWYFLVVEDKKEIEIIRKKICDGLNVPDVDCIVKEGIVENSHGLRYLIFSLQSPRDAIDFSSFYNEKTIRDARLYLQESKTNLLSVLEQEEIISEMPRRNGMQTEARPIHKPSPIPDYTH